jgi:hypothetical protein
MARLSKNRLLDGTQCPKLLWLRVHEPDAPELVPGPRQQALFDAGHEVGALARERFPGGVLVDVDRNDLAAAIAKTKELVRDRSRPLFEAVFSGGGVFSAVDVLEPARGGWRVNEVKAASSVKPQHVVDLAVQVYALRSAGVDVVGARLMHLNKECRFPDLNDLFVVEDLTDVVEDELRNVPGTIARLREVLEGPFPERGVGPHCRKPYPCPFQDRCRGALPDHHIGELYRLHESTRARLERACVTRIADIPPKFLLTGTQERQRRAVVSGELVVEPGLRERFALSKPGPRTYLDFESVSLPVPRWPGCWPWQQVPVQFSVHVERDGELEHIEYLAEAGEDPRPGLARALVRAVPREGIVLAYFEAFEKGRIRELAAAVPELATELLDIEGRILDLLPVVRDHVYHPGFRGSFSIKRVVPVLCPGEGWEGLEVASGEVAMVELARLLLDGSGLTASERVRLRQALLGYCERDTRTMVALLAKLRAIAGDRDSAG